MQHLQTDPPTTAEVAEDDFELVSEKDKLLVTLLRIKDLLVEKSESLSILLESRLDPSPALRLEGDEQAKARHLFVSQATKIEASINRLTKLVDGFRVHIY